MKAQSPSDERIIARVTRRARTPEGVATTAASLWRGYATPEYDLRDQAHRISAPTLVVWGERDPSLSLRFGRATQQAIDGAKLSVFPTGHVVFSSEPTGFLKEVNHFLDRIERSRCPAPTAERGNGS